MIASVCELVPFPTSARTDVGEAPRKEVPAGLDRYRLSEIFEPNLNSCSLKSDLRTRVAWCRLNGRFNSIGRVRVEYDAASVIPRLADSPGLDLGSRRFSWGDFSLNDCDRPLRLVHLKSPRSISHHIHPVLPSNLRQPRPGWFLLDAFPSWNAYSPSPNALASRSVDKGEHPYLRVSCLSNVRYRLAETAALGDL